MTSVSATEIVRQRGREETIRIDAMIMVPEVVGIICIISARRLPFCRVVN